MVKLAKKLGVLLVVLLVMAIARPVQSAEQDAKFKALYEEVAKLKGEEALKFFDSLPSKGVKGPEVIQFFIDLPVSKANSQIAKLFEDEGFGFYLDKYPRGAAYDNFQWQKGMGTEITGPFSKQPLKLPFTEYVQIGRAHV